VTLQAATVDRQRWSGGAADCSKHGQQASSDRKRSVADRRQPCTAKEQWRCRTKPCPGGKVHQLEKLICQIRRRHSVEALVNQNGELILDPFWSLQPV